MFKSIANSATFAMLIAVSSFALAGEGDTTTIRSASQTVRVPTTYIPSITVYRSPSEDSSTPTPPPEEEEVTSEVDTPFAHFRADDPGISIINSYLLAYLSDLVYSDTVLASSYEAELEAVLLPLGVNEVDVFINSWTGTEGAIVHLEDAVIVAFRGSHIGGSVQPWADHLGDINDDSVPRTVGGHQVRVHQGFWTNMDSVYDGIRASLQIAHDQGKKIWLTGHSLGGANATLTAFRLHYDAKIPVQGVQSFGAPRVGDGDFADAFASEDENGVRLSDQTIRWVVDGDPATTLFLRELSGLRPIYFLGFTYWIPEWVYYEHVGTTHTIFRSEDSEGQYQYDVEYDTGEDMDMTVNVAGLSDEHLEYYNGLLSELQRILLMTGEDQALVDVLKTL